MRVLPDGCARCGLSVVACDATAYVNNDQPCCTACNHN